MTRAERAALARMQRLADAGFIRFTNHAHQEMIDEMATTHDVLDAIREADQCDLQVNGRYQVGCTNLELVVIVELADDVVIVTVFGRT